MRRIPDHAFGSYLAMGPERSYAKVAELYGVSKRAIVKVAVREKWSGKLARVEEEIRDRVEETLGECLEEATARHLKLIRAIFARAAEGLRDHSFESAMEAVRGAQVAIKLERTIAGEPSERVAQTVESVTRQEIDRLIASAPDDGATGEGEPDDDDDDDPDDDDEDW